MTQVQGNPNVILKTDFDKTAMTRDDLAAYETSTIVPAVNTAYSNGATTVKVVDINDSQIGAYPRPNPNA